jgi:hypothetical protein
LPAPGTAEFKFAEDLERRIAAQRDLTLADFPHPFAFVRQTQQRWRIREEKSSRVIASDIAQGTVWIGSIGSKEAAFADNNAKETLVVETWIKSPKTQTLGAWIDCAGLVGAYSRLDVPHTPRRGEWNFCGAGVYVNGEKIEPPKWKQPGMKSTTKSICEQDIPYSTDLLEKPLADELVTLRPPTPITLKEGWNHVQIILPQRKSPRRGMTFSLIDGTSEHPREAEGLEYSSKPPAP